MGTILLVASEALEFRGLARRAALERLDWPLDFARRARVGDRRLLAVANGAGWERAAEAVRVAAGRERPAAVASVGFCGALEATLKAGDIVVADRVEAPATGETFATAERFCPRRGRRGSMISIDRVVRTPEEKRQLSASGAVAVEMEAAGVAREVRGLGLPFVSIRVVTDQAEEGFTIDYNQARDASGRIRRVRIIGLALRRPWRSVPELGRLYRRTRLASDALGEFLANCEFQL
jgi:hypothetical protein